MEQIKTCLDDVFDRYMQVKMSQNESIKICFFIHSVGEEFQAQISTLDKYLR